MKTLVWALATALILSGCAALQDIANVITGNSSQKITRTPIWVYKPDLLIIAGGESFSGYGATVLEDENQIQIQSLVHIDRVEISSCSRHDVCQVRGGDLACDPKRFLVERSFFGNAGKFMTYHYIPDRKERDDSCSNLMITVYDKNALAAWGYIVFRTNPKDNFPAVFTCNALDEPHLGVSPCSAKAGTIQEINFSQPTDNYRSEASCNIKKVSDSKFEFQPAVGWCRASFGQGPKFHDVILNGYDEILIRDGQ